MSKVAAQMYTLREYCQNIDGIKASLEKVKALGYDGIQASSSGFNTLDENDLKSIKQALDDNGLVCAATHESYNNMQDNPEAVIAKHKILDCSYTAIGGVGMGDKKEWISFANEFNGVTAKLNDAGLRAGYHNHSHEFKTLEDGSTPMHVMLEHFQPHVWMELDVYWAAHGLADPAAWIRKIDASGKNRIPCIHYKDGTVTDKREHVMMPVGEGNLNWEAINSATRDAGVEWFLVERDQGPHDPFDALELSLKNMKTMGI